MAGTELCSWTADTLPVGGRVGGDKRVLWWKGFKGRCLPVCLMCVCVCMSEKERKAANREEF